MEIHQDNVILGDFLHKYSTKNMIANFSRYLQIIMKVNYKVIIKENH